MFGSMHPLLRQLRVMQRFTDRFPTGLGSLRFADRFPTGFGSLPGGSAIAHVYGMQHSLFGSQARMAQVFDAQARMASVVGSPDWQMRDVTRRMERMFGRRERLERLMSGPQHLAEAFGAYQGFTRTLSQSRAGLLGNPTISHGAWSNVLEDLRSVVGAADVDQFEEVLREVDEADDAAADRPWVLRLSAVQAATLCLFAIQAMTSVGLFVADMADEKIPPEIRSGSQALFNLAMLLLIVLEQQRGGSS